MSDQWKERAKPARLERRYSFENYTALSEFLERAAEISERVDLFPDMGFGKDYVNITIHPTGNNEQLDDLHHQFAQELEMLFNEKQH